VSLPNDLLDQLGVLAFVCGQRPSSILGWDDPDDWFERFKFDGRVIAPIAKVLFTGKMSPK
jgi:hypothetical protein